MPQKWFECPDGGLIETQDCVALNGCRMGARCMSRPMLQKMARQRTWNGKPSVTQLLNGTYESMLKIREDYPEKPDGLIFSLLGTTVHTDLDKENGEGLLTEDDIGRLESDDGVTGLPDLVADEFGEVVLVDYKVSGSFKIAKALGLEYKLIESETEVYKQKAYIKDPDGGPTIVREKGQFKLTKLWDRNLAKQDCFEWVMQTNKYRLMLFEKKGIKVDKIIVQAIVRDGGTMSAKERGVVDRSYMIPIPILEDSVVSEYFNKKSLALLEAVAMDDWNEKCSVTETWGGRKCEEYCSVRHFCKFVNAK